MPTARLQPFAAMIIVLFVTASLAAEKQPSGHSSKLLCVKADTTLFTLANGTLRPIVQLPAHTKLILIEPPKAHVAPKHFIYVSFTHPTAGGPLVGWVDIRNKLETTRPTQDTGSNVSRLTNSTRQQSRDGIFNDEIPNLARINGGEELWKDVQEIITQAEAKELALSEPYKARADLWSRLHIHDEALKDYVTAAKHALASAPDGDLATYARQFNELLPAIELHNNVPKPPGPGLAVKHYGAGIRAYREGKFKYAVKLFSDALQLDENNAVYYYYRALAKKRIGDHRHAARDARTGSYHEWRVPYRSRSHISAGLAPIQGQLRTWLEAYRLGDPHYDPRRDKSLPNKLAPKQTKPSHEPSG